MIIRDYKKAECLGQYDDIKVYIKKADNQFFDGSVDTVITAICFTDLENNIIYKYSTSHYICKLEDKTNRSFNLNDFLEDLILYVSKCNIDKFYKNKTIENVLNNNFKGLYNIRQFKKAYYEQIQENINTKKAQEYKKQIDIIKKDIDNTIEEIKTTCKELIRIHKPNKNNNYCYELFTKCTYKKLETIHIYNNEEGIKEYKNILKFFNDYLYYISIDYDAVEFLTFDKVI